MEKSRWWPLFLNLLCFSVDSGRKLMIWLRLISLSLRLALQERSKSAHMPPHLCFTCLEKPNGQHEGGMSEWVAARDTIKLWHQQQQSDRQIRIESSYSPFVDSSIFSHNKTLITITWRTHSVTGLLTHIVMFIVVAVVSMFLFYMWMGIISCSMAAGLWWSVMPCDPEQ